MDLFALSLNMDNNLLFYGACLAIIVWVVVSLIRGR